MNLEQFKIAEEWGTALAYALVDSGTRQLDLAELLDLPIRFGQARISEIVHGKRLPYRSWYKTICELFPHLATLDENQLEDWQHQPRPNRRSPAPYTRSNNLHEAYVVGGRVLPQ